MTVLTMAGLTLLEASRRKVIWSLTALTALLLGLNGWGFSKLPGLQTGAGQLTSGQAALVASQLLNLVLFAMSLIVALGTAFLAGPTLAGELESGTALAVLARPVRRSAVLFGKWLGLAGFATVYVTLAGAAEFAIVWFTVGYAPPHPITALAMLSAEAIVLLTLALMFSSLLSPMSSGMLSVGLFGAIWVAGVVGGVGSVIGNESVARIGPISRVLLPTDGLWRGAMDAAQAPSLLGEMGREAAVNPFFATSAPTPVYLAWCVIWVGLVLGICLVTFARRDA